MALRDVTTGDKRANPRPAPPRRPGWPAGWLAGVGAACPEPNRFNTNLLSRRDKAIQERKGWPEHGSAAAAPRVAPRAAACHSVAGRGAQPLAGQRQATGEPGSWGGKQNDSDAPRPWQSGPWPTVASRPKPAARGLDRPHGQPMAGAAWPAHIFPCRCCAVGRKNKRGKGTGAAGQEKLAGEEEEEDASVAWARPRRSPATERRGSARIDRGSAGPARPAVRIAGVPAPAAHTDARRLGPTRAWLEYGPPPSQPGMPAARPLAPGSASQHYWRHWRPTPRPADHARV